MKTTKWIVMLMVPFLLAGCVSQGKYDTIEKEKTTLSAKLTTATTDLDAAKKKSDEQAKQLAELEQLRTENEQLKEKLDLYRKQANPSATDTSKYNTTVEQEYINNLIQVSDFQAKYFDSLLDGKVPGVMFKIKNKGNKILSEIEVTVYFKDVNGNNIAEESYTPVNDMDFDYKELKPNYTFQLDSDHFYTAKTVPKEWKAGNAEIKVTRIKFKDEL
ncbi:hypothetical protein [Paenibacillus durus]|uniref:Lipoprotein n=1 Tax=Paenibacillus durus TaxID=44251 RepID=A0A089HNM0_PAEDU|nr:hypothetical protein [Paenibacillus durus]AIQ11943.1 hypothetical protein PDUR_08340 [Paenibacillus durus]